MPYLNESLAKMATPPTPIGSRMSQVVEMTEILENDTEQLTTVVDALEARLSSVLHMSNPKPTEAEATKEQELVVLATKLRERHYRIQYVIRELQSIMERLEL